MVFFFLLLKYVKQANKQNWNPGCVCSLSEIKRKENSPMSPSLPLSNFSSQHYPTSDAIGGSWKHVSFFTKRNPQILSIIHTKNNYMFLFSLALQTHLFSMTTGSPSKCVCLQLLYKLIQKHTSYNKAEK